MGQKRKKAKPDLNEVAFRVVREATDPGAKPPPETKAAKAGRKGGEARSAKLSPARRRQIAKEAAKARWKAT